MKTRVIKYGKWHGRMISAFAITKLLEFKFENKDRHSETARNEDKLFVKSTIAAVKIILGYIEEQK